MAKNYTVTWVKDDEDSASPEEAAAEALASLNEARAGDAGADNVFIVTDHVKDIVHQVDLGDENSLLNTNTAIWPRPIGARWHSRLGPKDALLMLNDNGIITLRVRIDQDLYLRGYGMFASGSGGENHFDYLHEEALQDCGYPENPGDVIVAVDGSDFLVDYTTDLSFLRDGGTEADQWQ